MQKDESTLVLIFQPPPPKQSSIRPANVHEARYQPTFNHQEVSVESRHVGDESSELSSINRHPQSSQSNLRELGDLDFDIEESPQNTVSSQKIFCGPAQINKIPPNELAASTSPPEGLKNSLKNQGEQGRQRNIFYQDQASLLKHS